jgi:hypothetical protein
MTEKENNGGEKEQESNITVTVFEFNRHHLYW